MTETNPNFTLTRISKEDKELVKNWAEVSDQSMTEFISDAIHEYIAVNGDRIKMLALKRIESV